MHKTLTLSGFVLSALLSLTGGATAQDTPQDGATITIVPEGGTQPAPAQPGDAPSTGGTERITGVQILAITPRRGNNPLDPENPAAGSTAVSGSLEDCLGSFAMNEIQPQFFSVLDDMSNTFNKYPESYIDVIGHTDSDGSDEFNQALSERRANNVAGALQAQGVDASSMTVAGRSFNGLAVDTGPNVREPRNRRVEVNMSR